MDDGGLMENPAMNRLICETEKQVTSSPARHMMAG
jgi:hypothetical protein